MRTVPALLVAAMLLPLSVAQDGADDSGYAGGTVDLVLYAHIYDLLDAVPMNAHPMDPAAPDLARGYSSPTVAPQYGAAFNRIHFYNSMGPVEYNASLAEPRIHPEKGLAGDLQLDTSKDIVAYVYMSADALELQQAAFEPPAHAGAVPQLKVRAEVRLGNDVRKDLGAGNLVAAGETVLDVVTAPGQAEVMEIAINLGPAQMDAIPRRESFNLGLEWFQVENDQQQVLMPGWNIHTGAAYPNRLVLPVTNPLYLVFVEPQFQLDKVAVNAAFISPLGNYDLDAAGVVLDITGPGGFKPKTLSEPVLVQHTFQHNDHNSAALMGILWDYKTDNAPPGEYTVKATGTNMQRTATVEKSAKFTIEAQGAAGEATDSEGSEVVTEQQLQDQASQPARKSPGFEGLLLLLPALAMLLRRRQAS